MLFLDRRVGLGCACDGHRPLPVTEKFAWGCSKIFWEARNDLSLCLSTILLDGRAGYRSREAEFT